MATLNQAKVIRDVEKAVSASHSQFIYAFLKAYGIPDATIQRLKLGDRQRNIAAVHGDIALQGSLYFRPVREGGDLLAAANEIRSMALIKSGKIRFILVTDFNEVVGVDLKVDDQLTFPFNELKTQYEFFLPLTGLYEKPIAYVEHPADTRACEKMGRLYDGIRGVNRFETPEDLRRLNVFLTRLLFCFFAEDTGIFPGYNMMTDAITANTQRDGSDLPAFFERLFAILDLPNDDGRRRDFPASFQTFPYVDGGLFRERVRIPDFSARTRSLLIDCGQMAWRDISPVIFGSMFQAVMDPGERRSLGAHFTSEKNIFKVIGPLFLDDLREELEGILDLPAGKGKAKAKIKALEEYRAKLGSLKFLDPACGSGNFLIVAYRELRRLEIRCLSALRELKNESDMRMLDASSLVKVHIDQFHGIEILPFPVEVAKVSLYLMEHVMNLEMEKEFGEVYPTIPLRYTPNIVCANALTTPWEEVVRPEELNYIFGNPPFLGARIMSRGSTKKNEIKTIFDGIKNNENLDYVACWFKKAADYSLNTKIQIAFVATNSICQGEQVEILWGLLLKKYKIFINFAYKTFKWNNEASNSAAIHCVIIGLSYKENIIKTIFNTDNSFIRTNKISPFIIPGTNIFIESSKTQLNKTTPTMKFGNQPRDGGFFIFDDKEKKEICVKYDNLKKYFKRYIGAEDYINSKIRWCLWLKNIDKQEIENDIFLNNRVESVRKFRLASTAKTTQGYARVPHLFAQITQPDNVDYLLIPRVSSERREYIPVGFCNSQLISSDAVQIVPDATLYDFGILTSAMHMAWMRITCGRLEMRYRYARDLCYNTFPWPTVTDSQKASIESLADDILAARDAHPDMTLADMYNPETMPEDLRTAHATLDRAVDNLYCPGRTFEGDEDRLEILFALYEELTKEK